MPTNTSKSIHMNNITTSTAESTSTPNVNLPSRQNHHHTTSSPSVPYPEPISDFIEPSFIDLFANSQRQTLAPSVPVEVLISKLERPVSSLRSAVWGCGVLVALFIWNVDQYMTVSEESKWRARFQFYFPWGLYMISEIGWRCVFSSCLSVHVLPSVSLALYYSLQVSGGQLPLSRRCP